MQIFTVLILLLAPSSWAHIAVAPIDGVNPQNSLAGKPTNSKNDDLNQAWRSSDKLVNRLLDGFLDAPSEELLHHGTGLDKTTLGKSSRLSANLHFRSTQDHHLIALPALWAHAWRHDRVQQSSSALGSVTYGFQRQHGAFRSIALGAQLEDVSNVSVEHERATTIQDQAQPPSSYQIINGEQIPGSYENVAAERQDLFSRIAPLYDALNDVLSVGQHRLWKLYSVARALGWPAVSVNDGSLQVRLLDLCCGSGDIALIAASLVGRGGEVSALDFSAKLLQVAREKENLENSIAGLNTLRSNIEWIEGDALHLPFANNSFDAITMGYGLRNVVDRPRAMREMLRVLKPGGRAAILDFNNPENTAVKAFQGTVLDNLVVPAARFLRLGAEYEYLRPSIENFPTGFEQERLALDAGFSYALHEEIAGGLMGLLVATKSP